MISFYNIDIDYKIDVLGECAISSVLSWHNKKIKQWTSIAALRQTSVNSSILQLSFI